MPTSKVNQSENSKHDCKIIAFCKKINVSWYEEEKILSCVVFYLESSVSLNEF